MSTVTLEEAQAHLPQLIERLQPGEEIVITRDREAGGDGSRHAADFP